MEKININVNGKDCFGCSICKIICPKQIITTEINCNGFIQAHANDELCIKCGKCINYCPLHYYNIESDSVKSYSGWSNNSDILNQCTSGGIAFEIAKYGISNGYNIICVRYNYDKDIAEHYIADSYENLNFSIGSKYIQSDLYSALSKIDKYKKYIIFGTPCQISGIRNYLGNNSNYVLVDFFCHGVPSYNLFKKYIIKQKSKIGSIKAIHFRYKKNGGWQNSTTIKIIGNKSSYMKSLKQKDLFFRFFLKDRCLNKPCYDKCIYKNTSSAADIRLGDMWGKKYCTNEMGVSSILTFNNVGENIIAELSNCTINSETINDATDYQMKFNAKRSPSFYIVKWMLPILPLSFIDKVATFIELIIKDIPSYYIHLLLKKIKIK